MLLTQKSLQQLYIKSLPAHVAFPCGIVVMLCYAVLDFCIFDM